ncbi:MAG: DivIVA domain-containing protein [Actinomycetota bacterium]|nr:DivIVA domain-containing protein [Actinomycetota bacterium]
MIWIVVTAVILLFGVVVVLAVAGGTQLAPAHDDRREVRLPQGRHLRADDLAATRFTLALRGYRMSEVDALMDRLQVEMAEREHGPRRHDPDDVTAPRSGEGGPTPGNDHAR